MIYAGIDIAKDKHFCAIANSDGEVLEQPFGFDNNRTGYSLLLSRLKQFSRESVLIGMESTAHYGSNLLCFLHDNGYDTAVINPIQTATLRKTGIRKTKTDAIDSLLIIKSLIVNSHKTFDMQDLAYQRLKNLCRFRSKQKKSITRLKIQLVSYVDTAFPELQTFFKSGIHGKACYELLKKYPAKDEIAALHLTRLGNLLFESSHGHFGKEEAIALKSLAKSSVGTSDTSISHQIVSTIEQIELLEKQTASLDSLIISQVSDLHPILLSIPGMSHILCGTILGEIGDIRRFSEPCKLLAFAGLDPSVNQSGKFKAKSTRMSKRGSHLLRYALVLAAWNICLNNNTFNAYYELKRSQGHNHYSALGHVAHKLVRVIFKMLKDNVAFDLD
ncbi:MAG: IS110 family transposase [Clostridia bacterium]